MQGGDDFGKFALINGAINAVTQIGLEVARERFQAKQADLMRTFQQEQEDKRLTFQLQEGIKSREAQREIAFLNAKNQRDIALLNAENQRQLASLNNENQKKLAVDGAERRFALDNFPLYIRKWSSAESLKHVDFLPVKIVLAPPTVTESGKSFSGCEEFLTSAITQFLQNNLPKQYYEFLGGAWRDDRFKGQAAYKRIFEEFCDEPFLIIDCTVSRDTYFTFRLCFWQPGSPKYETFQLIENWDVRDLLQLSARNRAKAFYTEYVEPLQNSGKFVEKLFPERMANNLAYHKETFLAQNLGESQAKAVKYQLDADDYGECLRVFSSLCALITGTVVDTYQMAAGVSEKSAILPAMSREVNRFPETENLPVKSLVSNWILNEYEQLALSSAASNASDRSPGTPHSVTSSTNSSPPLNITPDTSSSPPLNVAPDTTPSTTSNVTSGTTPIPIPAPNNILNTGLSAGTTVNLIASLASVMLELDNPKLKSRAFSLLSRSWEAWCCSLGLSLEELGKVLHSQKDYEALLDILKEDKAALAELNRIYTLYDKTMRLGRNRELVKLAGAAGIEPGGIKV